LEDQKVVMFVDMLGFKSLVNSFSLNTKLFSLNERLLSPLITIDKIEEFMKNNLIKSFSGFHNSLQSVLSLSNMRYPVTSITFSDSAFISTSEVYQAADIAIQLIHSLLPQKIPIRIGIAVGSFQILKFSSNITPDSNNYSAQFLGTAVVRAYETESCGIKGIRALLHPSVLEKLNENQYKSIDHKMYPIRFIKCSNRESKSKYGIKHEIDYWHFNKTNEKKAWYGLQDMWNKASRKEEIHYRATAEAINRMRILQGYEPLNKLRRRTLPR